MKKGLIGLIVIAVLGGGYFGYLQYKNYQNEETARLIKEYEDDFVKIVEESKQREIKRQQEEQVSQERIAQGEGKVENVVTYYESGQKDLEYTLLEGKKHGSYLGWYESGNIKLESEYYNGLPIGESIWYFDSGIKKKQSSTKYDRTHKNKSYGELSERWNNNGIKTFESYSNSDKPEQEYGRNWNSNEGWLVSESFFDPESKLVVSISYYPSGQMKKKSFVTLSFSHPRGTKIYWYESGQKKAEYEYDDRGYINGWCHQWNENGDVTRKAFLKDDQEQKMNETIGFDESIPCYKI